MAKITIEYEIEDGYAGGARPFTFAVNANEFDGQSKAEVIETLSSLIGENFAQRISWTADLEAQADAICAKQAAE